MARSPILSDLDFENIKQRLDAGESRTSIARSLGRDVAAFNRLVERRYPDYKAPDASWEPTLNLPDDPAVLAYIAGLIDGEGTIMQISYGKGRKGRGWMVKVQMTDKPVIDWLGSFGGSKREYEPRQSHYKHVYAWHVARRRDVLNLLEKIVPYMIVKRMRAVEAINEIKAIGLENKE